MSTQRGNYNRSRPQKHQNQTVFKNDLHDTSTRTKVMNSMEVANVCNRCKKIIEWKIKYKKYKSLKALSKCTKCGKRTVKNSYHIMCLPCAKQHEICPKCGNKDEIVEGSLDKQEAIKLEAELQSLLKKLSERRRRTFIRYMNRNTKNNGQNLKKDNKSDESADTNYEGPQQNNTIEETVSKQNLLLKLKSLILNEKDNDFDTDEDDSDSFV